MRYLNCIKWLAEWLQTCQTNASRTFKICILYCYAFLKAHSKHIINGYSFSTPNKQQTHSCAAYLEQSVNSARKCEVTETAEVYNGKCTLKLETFCSCSLVRIVYNLSFFKNRHWTEIYKNASIFTTENFRKQTKNTERTVTCTHVITKLPAFKMRNKIKTNQHTLSTCKKFIATWDLNT